jgi:hypothetical protein
MPLDPTTSIIFTLYSGSGAPAPGLVPTFAAYEDFSGGTVTPPAIVEIGLGAYGFTPNPTDIANGTAYIIDGTSSANPRYSSGSLQPGVDINVDVAAILALATSTNEFLFGRWKLDPVANTLTMYAPDNVTVLATFNTLDANGNPTTSLIFERTVA